MCMRGVSSPAFGGWNVLLLTQAAIAESQKPGASCAVDQSGRTRLGQPLKIVMPLADPVQELNCTLLHLQSCSPSHACDAVVWHTPSPKQHLDSGKSIWVWSSARSTRDTEGFHIRISNMSILPRASGGSDGFWQLGCKRRACASVCVWCMCAQR